jgi:hypothetical protein
VNGSSHTSISHKLSILPERLMRPLVPMMLPPIPREPPLTEQMKLTILLRRFVGLGLKCDAAILRKNRQRLPN